MSGDPRDYYPHSRSDERALPSLREILGDALDRPPVSPYSFDFRDVNRALPGSSKSYGRHPSVYYPQRGPTLPPIRHYPPSRSHSSSLHARGSSSDGNPHHDHRRPPPESEPMQAASSSQSASGKPSPYSFNVLRAQQGDLVDVRTPSTRAQGILRPTAIIEDEDDSHKRYKCDWPGCEKKYDRPSSLEVHRHTHTGQQPYPCPYKGCPRAFNVKSNMLRHFRSHPKATTPQVSAGQEEHDSDSDEDKWPTVSNERYFLTAKPSSSSSATTNTPSKTSGDSLIPSESSTSYYSSSRRH